MPSTAVYSRTDGVAAWELCVEDESPIAESIEVYGSHCGMPLNPLVFHIIADRLSQSPGEWRKFSPCSIPAQLFDLMLGPARDFLTMTHRKSGEGDGD